MATERIIIVVEERGTRRVKQRIREVGSTAKRSNANVLLLQKSLLALGGIAILRKAIGTLANFEQQLSIVRGISGATEAQFAQLRDTAADLGATTRFSATQAAEGLVFLARAGFSVNEQLESIDDTLLLAQAGALDLGSAADIASNVLRGFRLEATEAGRAVDVLALAANSSNTNVMQLGDALKFVAPIAAGLGVSLEETTAAVGALSDAGLQSSLAGTGLRRVLSELESPASKTTQILKSLGLTADDVRISQVGLTAAVRTLAEAGLDTGQALELFGDRGGPAFEVLSQAIPRVIQFTQELENASGNAARLAGVMDDNLNGALFAARSALEALILALGEAGITDALESLFRGLAATLRFTANNAVILQGALIGLAVGQIPKLITLIPVLITQLRLLTVAIASTGIGAVAVVIGIAVGALVKFQDQLRLNADSTATLGDVFTATFETIGSVISGVVLFAEQAFNGLRGFIEPIVGDVEFTFQGLLIASARFADNFVGFFEGSVLAAVQAVRGLGPAIQDLAISAVNGLIGQIETGVRSLQAIVITLVQSFGIVANQVNVGIINLAEAGRQALAGNVEEAKQFAENAAFFISNAAEQGFAGFGMRLGQAFNDVSAEPLLDRLINPSEGAAQDLGRAIKEAFFEGFDRNDIEQSVLGIIARAEEIAREREAASVTGPPGAPGTVPGGVVGDSPELKARSAALQQINADLENQAKLLGLTNRERVIAADLQNIEQDLGRSNVTLTEQERALFEERLRNLQALQEQAEVLEDIRGPQEQLAARQMALIALFDQGRISAEEYSEGLRLIQRASLETDRTLSGGFERGLMRVGEQIANFSDQAEATIVNAFGSAEDALVKFVQTGEVDFSRLVDSILGDLTRLLAKQALFGLINSFGGGGGGGGGGLGGLGSLLGGLFKQAGGPVGANESVVVGENGRELFTPRTPGNITPNGPTERMMSAPAVNVVVVNQGSDDDVLAVLDMPEATEIIFNKIERNPKRVNATLGNRS